LSQKIGKDHKLSTSEVFIDIAKNGNNNSVKRLRVHGITPEKIDQLVRQLGWQVVK
jgi:hypothetical protein